jgi:hypothetical protein
MASHSRKSEKEKAKDLRFKKNVAILLKRFEREMQEARNRHASIASRRPDDWETASVEAHTDETSR